VETATKGGILRLNKQSHIVSECEEDQMTLEEFLNGSRKICIIGLGYVGLPLATILSRKFSIVGFDVNERRIQELNAGNDFTNEVDQKSLQSCGIQFSSDPAVISECSILIVTVPTPVNSFKIPDLSPVISASKTVAQNMVKGSIVVYESTVYPGVTEGKCVPILTEESGFKYLQDFNVGYSPERVNPGDKAHTVDRIKKIVSGDTDEVKELLCSIYGEVITAGIHPATDIKTAEAAKVIENTQRDLNIALMNELALIFNRMGIDTNDVLDAAATKWNFIRFEPGLVGGHCIGVDPYYLTFAAESLGYRPEVILAGRRINDSMGKFIAEKTVKLLIRCGKVVQGSRVLIMGLTFKENINDIRNTRVTDIIDEMKEYGVSVTVWDPHADKEDVRLEYGINLLESPEADAQYDAVIVAVKHKEIIDNYPLENIRDLCSAEKPVLIDVKSLFKRKDADDLNFTYWCL